MFHMFPAAVHDMAETVASHETADSGTAFAGGLVDRVGEMCDSSVRRRVLSLSLGYQDVEVRWVAINLPVGIGHGSEDLARIQR